MKLHLLSEAKSVANDLSTEETLNLLRRKLAFYQSYIDKMIRPSIQRATDAYHVSAYINTIPDVTPLTPDDQQQIFNAYKYQSPLSSAIVGYAKNPNDYIARPSTATLADSHKSVSLSVPLDQVRMVLVLDKATAAKLHLDEDDVDDALEEEKHNLQFRAKIKTLEGRISRMQKKYADEQAAALLKNSTTSTSATLSSPSNPPPQTLFLSKRNANMPNPYYFSTAVSKFVGHPGHAPYKKASIKSMMNVMMVACSNVNNPLNLIYYATLSNDNDAFYAESATKKIKLHIIGTSGREMSIIIDDKVYRLKRVYHPGDIQETTSVISRILGNTPPPGV